MRYLRQFVARAFGSHLPDVSVLCDLELAAAMPAVDAAADFVLRVFASGARPPRVVWEARVGSGRRTSRAALFERSDVPDLLHFRLLTDAVEMAEERGGKQVELARSPDMDRGRLDCYIHEVLVFWEQWIDEVSIGFERRRDGAAFLRSLELPIELARASDLRVRALIGQRTSGHWLIIADCDEGFLSMEVVGGRHQARRGEAGVT